MTSTSTVLDLLARYRGSNPVESAHVDRILDLVTRAEDPWSQEIPLHVTASAIVVDPIGRRVLLRWHSRQQAWLQIGGHGDPGETDPIDVALREGAEETGLPDLSPWPTADLVHVVVVPVAPKAGGADTNGTPTFTSAAHEHADLRFLLSTMVPESARPERADAELRWLTVAEAMELTSETNLRETLRRVAVLLDGAAA